MKTINEFIKHNQYIDEDLINEDAMSTLILMNLWITIICNLMVLGDFGTSSKITNSEGMFDSIKRWWRDKKIQKIVKRLAKDQEVKDFLDLPKSEQHGGWQKLLKDKLSEEEQKYIKSISKNKVRNNI